MIGFGGPTRADEVRPFLDNVLRGRPIPRERYEEVVHHYDLLGGRSPYNDLTMRQAAALREQLAKKGVRVPVAVGMREWEPYVADAIRALADGGARRALCFGRSGARSRVSPAMARPSAVHRGAGGAHPRGVRAPRRASAVARAPYLHRTQHSARDGAGRPVRQAACAVSVDGRRQAWNRRLETRLSKPQRESARGVARTRHQGYACEPRHQGGGSRADRFFVRSRRSAVRSRYRGGANRTRGGNQDGARADRVP